MICLLSTLSGLKDNYLSELLLLFFFFGWILFAFTNIGYGYDLLFYALIVSKSIKYEFLPKEHAAVPMDEDTCVFEFLYEDDLKLIDCFLLFFIFIFMLLL